MPRCCPPRRLCLCKTETISSEMHPGGADNNQFAHVGLWARAAAVVPWPPISALQCSHSEALSFASHTRAWCYLVAAGAVASTYACTHSGNTTGRGSLKCSLYGRPSQRAAAAACATRTQPERHWHWQVASQEERAAVKTRVIALAQLSFDTPEAAPATD